MARPAKPWYRTADGAWYCTHDGRKVRLVSGPKAETADEARRAFHALKAQQPGAGGPKPSTLVVGELIARFLDSVEATRKASTYHWYLATFRTFRDRHRNDLAADIRPITCPTFNWMNSAEERSSSRRLWHRRHG